MPVLSLKSLNAAPPLLYLVKDSSFSVLSGNLTFPLVMSFPYFISKEKDKEEITITYSSFPDLQRIPGNFVTSS